MLVLTVFILEALAGDSTAKSSQRAELGSDFKILRRLRTKLIQNCPFIIPTLQSNAPAYEALSYVWGSQENPKPIRLNGHVYHVTENLHAALTRIRLPAEDHFLWSDALAINQLDLAERSDQVKAMPSIYSSAEKTLVWLGEGSPAST
ncbi:heterokaryon incompatibility protein-domain-containing protein [Podospora didyma]|uniref:Heterokaryon incompatibility protein-domain-containing protein n=1 Tax=Podospora didyma TaxID=330526 RepID=A0AAE0P027_9PEZI|nr:heterokaryon incompatibility protein-domain-containing protein [Podospora didyma]